MKDTQLYAQILGIREAVAGLLVHSDGQAHADRPHVLSQQQGSARRHKVPDASIRQPKYPFGDDVQLYLADEMASEFKNIVQFKLNAEKKVGSYNTAKLWHITDKSDLIFLKYMTDQPEQVFERLTHHVAQTVITHKSEGN